MLTDDIKQAIQSAYSTLLESKGIKARYGQRLMIAEVAKTLASGSPGASDSTGPVCVVEAGTGTGKTIAYSVAAIPIAKALEKKLVIATATVALQEQIVYKDLPDIQHHSGLDFTFALAKGRGRYLCLSKLDAVLQQSEVNQQVMALYPDELAYQVDAQSLNVYQQMLTALVSGDWDGDKDSWSQELDGPLWSRVTTDHAQCTGRRCANITQCSFFKAREQLTKVDVIVTNHDLVMSDLALGGGAILPEPEETIYIFDEGHHLPDKAINHFASFSRVRSTERWLDQGAKVISKAAPHLAALGDISRQLQALSLSIDTVKQYLSALFSYLEQLVQPGENTSNSSKMAAGRSDLYLRFENGVVPEQLRTQAVELAAQYANIYELLDRVCSALEGVMEDGGSLPKAEAENWFVPLSLMRARVESNCTLWRDYSCADKVESPPRGRWIAVVEVAGSFDFEVSSSPILAANTLSRFLWNRCYAAVVTSATLTALGRFERFAMRAGTPEATNYVVVPSPFDYAVAGEIVVPAMSCDPSDAEAHTQALIEMLPVLLSPKEGSLVLFASRRQMEEVFQGVEREWQQRILIQGSLGKHEILRLHKEAVDSGKGSVIFGLASFAEGVDLPGAYCAHVVIAKIPFAVPDQPMESALAEWVASRGGDPFMDITVPDAAVKLVQASGRLLRTETDQGRITLLDRRIVSRRYGRAMLDSLPPFRRSIQ